MTHSEIKQFAFEVLDVIDDLIKPEIQNGIIERFWKFFTGHAKKKILNKSDNEIIEKLLIIQKKLNTNFQDLNKSVEINAAERMGSVPIPKVGELHRIKKLTQTSQDQVEQLERELRL